METALSTLKTLVETEKERQTDSDAEIINGLRSGDPEKRDVAGQAAVLKHGTRVLAFVKDQLPLFSSEDHLDIHQDTFSCLYLRSAGLMDGRPLWPFIRQIAWNKCMDRLREHYRRPDRVVDDYERALNGVEPGNAYADIEHRERMRTLIDLFRGIVINLARGDQQMVAAIVLKDFFPDWPSGSKDVERICDVLKNMTGKPISYGSVKSHVQRLKQRFKKSVMTAIVAGCL